MSEYTASCRCGAWQARVRGEPRRISVCHCLACQKRSGSAFGAAVRFAVDEVTMSGTTSEWTRVADSGSRCTYHFCPTCGATVWYANEHFGDLVAIPLGLFDDPYVFVPGHSVWEERKHRWVEVTGDAVERMQ